MIFRLANHADDPKLRSLMRETVVPGHIKLVYAREPDFFVAYRDNDEQTQVIVAEDQGRINGVACRSVRNLLVNGKPSPVGYLSGLRLRASVRNSTALARGYAYLKTLHADQQVPFYLTTIIQGNRTAQEILTSGRAGLPSYLPIGSYLTHVCPIRKSLVPPGVQGEVQIDAASQIPMDELKDYLLREGARRQFFPVPASTGQSSGILRSIGHDHVLVARKQGKIVGTLAVWNQEKSKQHIVAGYSPFFRICRPVINLGLLAGNFHVLPRAGGVLRCGVAALICIRDNDQAVFKKMLRYAFAMASASGLQQLAIGLHERDPLAPALKDFLHVVYRSGVYLVSWEGRPSDDLLGGTLVPYLEIGML